MITHQIKSFYYKNDLYIRVVPSKRLFNSTMVHEVVNRGDVFAMRVADQQLTIIPGTSQVSHGAIAVDQTILKQVEQIDLFVGE